MYHCIGLYSINICLYWRIYVRMYRLEYYMYQCIRICPTKIGKKNFIQNAHYEAQ
jgi:hypothetical protein